MNIPPFSENALALFFIQSTILQLLAGWGYIFQPKYHPSLLRLLPWDIPFCVYPMAWKYRTGFGSGFSPFAPGTAGALLATLIWLALSCAVSPTLLLIITALLIGIFTIAGIRSANAVEPIWGEDPSRKIHKELGYSHYHLYRTSFFPDYIGFPRQSS
jgi:hypothetical protein